jgi:hypothetical protein
MNALYKLLTIGIVIVLTCCESKTQLPPEPEALYEQYKEGVVVVVNQY